MSKLKELYAEYMEQCHRMQTGVAFSMHGEDESCKPKHLRVGVNSAMSNHGALVELLIEKGMFTEEEYMEKLLKFMTQEADEYCEKLQGDSKTKVTLV